MNITFCTANSGRKNVKLVNRAGLILLSLFLAGCPAGPKPSETAAEKKVVIRGSNTIGEELAPGLIAEFKKNNPAASFDLESRATGYGVASLMAGQCDIAGASREALKQELEEARVRGIEFNDHVIGSYSVAVIVNAGSPVGNLTRDLVRDIFTGAVQNWKEVGGPDAPIHLYIRDAISGTHLGFKELAMENKPYASGSKMLTNYAAIVQAVAQDAHGISYASIDLAKKAGVKAVSIGGVAPSAAAVNKGQYPYSRVLRLYTNKSREASMARDFIQFVQSPRGQETVAQMGFVPRP